MVTEAVTASVADVLQLRKASSAGSSGAGSLQLSELEIKHGFLQVWLPPTRQYANVESSSHTRANARSAAMPAGQHMLHVFSAANPSCCQCRTTSAVIIHRQPMLASISLIVSSMISYYSGHCMQCRLQMGCIFCTRKPTRSTGASAQRPSASQLLAPGSLQGLALPCWQTSAAPILLRQHLTMATAVPPWQHSLSRSILTLPCLVLSVSLLAAPQLLLTGSCTDRLPMSTVLTFLVAACGLVSSAAAIVSVLVATGRLSAEAMLSCITC